MIYMIYMIYIIFIIYIIYIIYLSVCLSISAVFSPTDGNMSNRPHTSAFIFSHSPFMFPWCSAMMLHHGLDGIQGLPHQGRWDTSGIFWIWGESLSKFIRETT